jgi:hypothetical protein
MIFSSNRASQARNPAADYIVTLYLFALALAVAVHEVGHLFAGWMVGFRFSSITIGPIGLRLEYGRLKIHFQSRLPAGGYAGMHVNQIRRLRCRLLIFTAGGPAANLLSAAVIPFFLAHASLNDSWLSVAAEIFWIISRILGIANLLPFRIAILYPDGAMIRLLLWSRSQARRWISNRRHWRPKPEESGQSIGNGHG